MTKKFQQRNCFQPEIMNGLIGNNCSLDPCTSQRLVPRLNLLSIISGCESGFAVHRWLCSRQHFHAQSLLLPSSSWQTRLCGRETPSRRSSQHLTKIGLTLVKTFREWSSGTGTTPCTSWTLCICWRDFATPQQLIQASPIQISRPACLAMFLKPSPRRGQLEWTTLISLTNIW